MLTFQDLVLESDNVLLVDETFKELEKEKTKHLKAVEGYDFGCGFEDGLCVASKTGENYFWKKVFCLLHMCDKALENRKINQNHQVLEFFDKSLFNSEFLLTK